TTSLPPWFSSSISSKACSVAGRPPALEAGVADQWGPDPRRTQPDLVPPPLYLLLYISPADMASHAINPARVPPFAAMASTLGCQIASFPQPYLGLPLTACKIR